MFRILCGVLTILGISPLTSAPAMAQVPPPPSFEIKSLEDAKKLPDSAKGVSAERVGDDVINYLADRGGLVTVRVSSSRGISSSALSELCALPGLQVLLLDQCGGVDEDVANAIAANKTLTELRVLACEPATTAVISALFTSKSIKTLALKDMAGVNNESLRSCTETSSIEILHLALGSHVHGEALAYLMRLPKLCAVSVESFSIYDRGIEELAKCKALRVLSLSCMVDGSFAGPLLAAIPLTELYLSGCGWIVPELLDFTHAKSLRNLSLPDRLIHSESGLDWMARLTELERLSFTYTTGMAGRWKSLVKTFGKLKSLILNGTDVTDADLAEIAKLSSLTEVRLTSCKRITVKGFDQLLKLPNLETLDVYKCDGIEYDEDKVLKTRKAKPNCIIIYPDGPG